MRLLGAAAACVFVAARGPATRPQTSYVINAKFEHRNIQQPLNDPTWGNATQTRIEEQKLTKLLTALFGGEGASGSKQSEAVLDTARTVASTQPRRGKRSTRDRAEYTVTRNCTVLLELDPGQLLSCLLYTSPSPRD